jgi:hypothetical protein
MYGYETLCSQLTREQRGGRVFPGWNEGRIYFPPTYKYSNNSDKYAGEDMNQKEKKRTPAWYLYIYVIAITVLEFASPFVKFCQQLAKENWQPVYPFQVRPHPVVREGAQPALLRPRRVALLGPQTCLQHVHCRGGIDQPQPDPEDEFLELPAGHRGTAAVLVWVHGDRSLWVHRPQFLLRNGQRNSHAAEL